MNYVYNNKKDEFLIKEIMQNSISASFQTRNEEFPIYNYENLDLNSAKYLRNEIKDFLLLYLHNYKTIDEKGHIAKIKELSDILSSKYSKILYNGRFRIGISQKVINLFLKYMWSIGKIDVPYHCPIDNIIKIKVLKGLKNITLKDWTELDNIKDYLKYIELIRIKSINSNISIAEWELENWKKG
jgi:hypothetical protein